MKKMKNQLSQKKMNNLTVKVVYCLFLSAFVSACSLFQQAAPVVVSEEGPLNLSRITDPDSEPTYGPIVNMISGLWTPGSYLSVDDKGEAIYFLSERNGNKNIFMKSISTNSRSSSQKTFRSDVGDMAISPDGKRIAFTDRSSANINIFAASLEGGSAISQVTFVEGVERNPCYAKSGEILFYSGTVGYSSQAEEPRYYIWGVDLANSAQTQYAEGMEPASLSSLTKDKKGAKLTDEIILISRKNYQTKKTEIWKINLTTGEEMLILSNPKRSYSSPKPSPDGKYMAFVAETPKTKNNPANVDIYICKLDGSNLMQLTYHPGADCSPVWHPSGEHIYFISSRACKKNRYGVWRMNVPKLN